MPAVALEDEDEDEDCGAAVLLIWMRVMSRLLESTLCKRDYYTVYIGRLVTRLLPTGRTAPSKDEGDEDEKRVWEYRKFSERGRIFSPPSQSHVSDTVEHRDDLLKDEIYHSSKHIKGRYVFPCVIEDK